MTPPPNPFIELYRQPVAVLGRLAYALLLLGVSLQLGARGWSYLVWLGNAWEFRDTDAQFGDKWTWYLPPAAVYNRITIVVLLGAVEAFLLSAFVFVVS